MTSGSSADSTPGTDSGRSGAADTRHRRDVLVVGAGPVGLATALALRAKGLAATVLEAGAEGRARPGSRAIYVHRETLEQLEAIRPGLGWQIASRGLVWGAKRTTWRGREVFARNYPPPDPSVLPPFASLAQVETEAMLAEAAKQAGAEMVWDSTVSGVKADAGGVELTTEEGSTWSAGYVIAADGAHSSVRASLGIAMEGSRSESSFVIVDVEEVPDNPLPLERVFHYNHPSVEGRNLLTVPFAGGWRVDLQCREDDDAEAMSDPEGVRRWMRQVLPPGYAERVGWVSTYRFLQVVAKELTDASGRVLLVGEAAHLFSPFGARGMNSGVVDAVAAAEAVSRAGGAAAGAGAGGATDPIAEFARTRMEAALYNRAAASASLTHMQGDGAVMQVKRRLAAALALYGQRAGSWLDSAPYGPRGGSRREGPGRY